jgi:hypothetical protein
MVTHSLRAIPHCRRSGGPLHLELLLVHRAIAQVKVDQVLVGHPHLVRQTLEVINRQGVKPDGDGLLEEFDVGIFHPVREVVVVSHFLLQ